MVGEPRGVDTTGEDAASGVGHTGRQAARGAQAYTPMHSTKNCCQELSSWFNKQRRLQPSGNLVD